MDTMKIIGHRGASEDAPENTLESVKLAWEQGAYAAECDIIRTHDGKLVLMHDDSTKRTALGGVDLVVEHTAWKDLKKLDVGSWKGEKWKGVKIPLLEEVLRAIPDGKHLYIEVKSGNTNRGAESRVIDDLENLIGKEKISPEKITFICFDHDFLNRLKKRLPRYSVYYLTSFVEFPGTWPEVRSEAELELYIREAHNNGIDGLDMENSSVITEEWVRKIHDKELKVAIWSYGEDDTIENARRYKDIGIDFLTTNMPAAILQGLDPSCR
jgi:glycerophosphoryl diester phosphodiesterase